MIAAFTPCTLKGSVSAPPSKSMAFRSGAKEDLSAEEPEKEPDTRPEQHGEEHLWEKEEFV